MRKIIVTMWMTLDGFIAGPNGEMDWVGESYDEAMGNYEYDLVSSADTLWKRDKCHGGWRVHLL